MKDDDKPNIRELPSLNTKSLMAAVMAMKRELPAYLEMASVMAEIRRAHYDAYIKKGFTPEQALDLAKKITL